MAERKGLSEAVSHFSGQWVAADSRTNEPRAAAETPHELTAEIKRCGLRNVAIIRARVPWERVGLG